MRGSVRNSRLTIGNLDGPAATVKENLPLSEITDRIIAARKALGYESPKDAHRDGAPAKAAQSLYDWESGTTVPAAYLEWLAMRGASADYLLLGWKPILRKDMDAARAQIQIIATVASGAPASDVRAMLDLIASWEGEAGDPASGGPEDGADGDG